MRDRAIPDFCFEIPDANKTTESFEIVVRETLSNLLSGLIRSGLFGYLHQIGGDLIAQLHDVLLRRPPRKHVARRCRIGFLKTTAPGPLRPSSPAP
jgi:hypothetical protein